MQPQIQSLFTRKSVTVIFCPNQDSKNTIDYRLIDTVLDASISFYEISLKGNQPNNLSKEVEKTIQTEHNNEAAFGRQFNPEWYLVDLAPVETYYNDLDHAAEFCDQLLELETVAQNENAKIVLIIAASDVWLNARMITTYLTEKAPESEKHFTLVAVTRKYPIQLKIVNGARESQTIDFPPDPEPVY